MTPSPLDVLELPPSATQAQIKAAYRRLVRLYHPDNNPGFPDEAAAKLRELRDAYDHALRGESMPARPAPQPAAPAWQPPAPQPRPTAAQAGRRARRGRRTAQTYERPWQAPPLNRHENPPRRMDPPKVPPKQPPKPAGPAPPAPKYVHVPPARPESAPTADPAPSAAEVAARSVQRARLVDDLVATGFVGHADELALDHAVLDAFLPVLGDGERVHACARYDDVAAAGLPPTLRHTVVLVHPLPVAAPEAGDQASGELSPRDLALAALVRGRFVACTDRRLLWTVSRLRPGGGTQAHERVEVHAEELGQVARVSAMQGGVGLGFTAGLAVRFRLPDDAATDLVAAIEAGGGGAPPRR